MRGEPLYLDGNDDIPASTVETPAVTTGILIPATGLAGLTFRLSATRNGAAIHASLSVTASERGVLGIYYGTYLGTDLTTRLATYGGKDVFQVFGDGLKVNYVISRRVLAVRP